jgi:hypothetical protein
MILTERGMPMGARNIGGYAGTYSCRTPPRVDSSRSLLAICSLRPAFCQTELSTR